MSYLKGASVNQIKTLFSLFPIKVLKDTWTDIEGNKADITLEIAGKRDIDRYSEFFHNNFGVCKQHLYIFDTDISAKALFGFKIFSMWKN